MKSSANGIVITRPVIIKVKVTENYKKLLLFELQQAIQKLDAQLRHLEIQARQAVLEIEKKNPRALDGIREKFEADRRRLLEGRQQVMERIKETARLKVGEEIVHGRAESLVEINVGDKWAQVMGVEVVVEDGVIVDIRTGQTGRGSDDV